MTLLPAVLLLGQTVLDAMWAFTWKMLLLAPVAIAGLTFSAWLMSAPSRDARWTERWIGRGIGLSFNAWLANIFAVSIALWSWVHHQVAVLPQEYMDRGGPLAALGITAPGFVVTFLAVALVRASTRLESEQ